MRLVGGIERRVTGDSVVLVHPVSGREERLTAVEALVLSYVNAAPTAKVVAERASDGGVAFAEQDAESLLSRLQASGFIEIETTADNLIGAFLEEHAVTVMRPSGLELPAAATHAHEAFPSAEAEVFTSVDIEIDQMLLTGQFSRPAEFQAFVSSTPLDLNVCPKLRASVRFSRATVARVKVEDTVLGVTHEVFELEAMIGRKLDGATSLLSLAAVTASVGVTLPQVESVARQWQAWGFLEPLVEPSPVDALPFEVEPAPLEAAAAPAEALDPPPESSPALMLPMAPGLGAGAVFPAAAPQDLAAESAVAVDPEPPVVIGEALPISRPPNRWRRWVLLPAALTLLVVALQVIEAPLRIVKPIVLSPAARGSVRAQLNGTVQWVGIAQAQQVKADEVLLRLDDVELKQALASASAEQSAGRAQMVLLMQAQRPAEVAKAQAQVDRLKKAVKLARAPVTAMARKPRSAKLERAEGDLAKKVAALASAEDSLVQLRAGRREAIRLLGVKLDEAMARQTALAAQLSLLEIRSPIDGIVLASKVPSKGDPTKAGQDLAEVVDLRAMKLRFQLDPDEVGLVGTGSQAVVRLADDKTREFAASVESVTDLGEKDGQRVVEVVASLGNPDLVLRQDMVGSAELEAGRRPLLELIARRWR